MQRYRRRHKPGGAFFFTLVTYDRAPLFTAESSRQALRDAMTSCRRRRPFTIEAMVLLPEHLHIILRLPPGEENYEMRWNIIKRTFTREYLASGGREGVISAARERQGYRGVLQRRFHEHTIRDDEDLLNHVKYIHYNPVKHGHCHCPHEWPYSTFAQWVERGFHRTDWRCACHGPAPLPLDFDDINAGE